MIHKIGTGFKRYLKESKSKKIKIVITLLNSDKVIGTVTSLKQSYFVVETDVDSDRMIPYKSVLYISIPKVRSRVQLEQRNEEKY